MNYEQWTGWNADSFALTSRADAAYFDAEVFDRLLLPAASRVLEVGFGNGSSMGHARRIGHRVTGIETNVALQSRASAAGFDVITTTVDIAGDTFDAVMAFDVLEHIPAEDTVEFLGKLARSLKTGGSIVLRFPNGDSPFGRVNQHGDVTHVNVIGSTKIRYFASAAGLSVVTIKNPERPSAHLSARQRCGRLLRSVIVASVERLVGWTFFGGRLPLAPNMIAVLKKP